MAAMTPSRPAASVRRKLRLPLERLRALCLALPDTSEKRSHGEPSWFVGKKLFVTYADHHHDERVAFWCAAPDGAQETLVALDPARYFRPPYVGHRGWLGVYLDVPVDGNEIAAHVRAAWFEVAPRKRPALVSESTRGASRSKSPPR